MDQLKFISSQTQRELDQPSESAEPAKVSPFKN